MTVTNPHCTDGDETFCCIDHDGTGLWCGSCLSYPALSRWLSNNSDGPVVPQRST